MKKNFFWKKSPEKSPKKVNQKNELNLKKSKFETKNFFEKDLKNYGSLNFEEFGGEKKLLKVWKIKLNKNF